MRFFERDNEFGFTMADADFPRGPWLYDMNKRVALVVDCPCGGGADVVVEFNFECEAFVHVPVEPCVDCGAIAPKDAVDATIDAAAAQSAGAWMGRND